MKKIFILLAFMLTTVSFVWPGTFEIGPRTGYISFSEELVGDNGAYGFETSYNFNDNWRIKASVDFFESERETQQMEYPFTITYTENERVWVDSTLCDASTTYTYYYTKVKDYHYEFTIIPAFFELDYTWNFSNISIFAGLGAGVAFVDAEADLIIFINNDMTNEKTYNNEGLVYDMDMDNSAFIYGASVGIVYTIYENWNLNLNINCVTGNVKYTSIETQYGTMVSSSKQDVDLDNYNIFISLHYKK